MDTYKAKAGDSLAKIAEQAGTTVNEIIKANPDIQNPDLIYAGRTYNLPTQSLYEYNGSTWVKNKEATANIDEDIDFKNIEKLGKDTLVDFNDDDGPTIFLYNSEEKTYTPVESIEAIANYYDVPISTIERKVNHVNSSIRNSPGMEGNIVGYDYRVKEDGSKTELPKEEDVDITGLSNIYGKKNKDVEGEDTASKVLGTLFTTVKLTGDISEEVFQNTVANPAQMAKYVNAWLYGDYNLGDIYRDVKSKELNAQGVAGYKDFKAFDENTTAGTWKQTEDGKKSLNDINLSVPEGLNIDRSLFDLPIFQIPGAAFSTLVEPIDFSSPEFKEEAEGIQAAYYDIMTQKVEAQTEQEKAIADNNWKIFREDLEKKFGFQLSDSAEGAWGQLQGIFAGSAKRGLTGSGITQELVDRQLQSTRKADERLRQSNISQEEMQQRNYLLQHGSPEQIDAFAKDNPEKAKEWGLTPDQDTADFFSLESLRKLYPDKPDSELLQYRNLVLNDQGNVQSSLYKRLYGDKFDLAGDKKAYQEGTLYNQKLNEEEKAYRPFTSSSPFLTREVDTSAIGKKSPQIETPPPAEVPKKSSFELDQIKKARDFADNAPFSKAKDFADNIPFQQSKKFANNTPRNTAENTAARSKVGLKTSQVEPPVTSYSDQLKDTLDKGVINKEQYKNANNLFDRKKKEKFPISGDRKL